MVAEYFSNILVHFSNRVCKIQEGKGGLRKKTGEGGGVCLSKRHPTAWRCTLACEEKNADIAALLLILLLVQIVVSTRPLSILHRPTNGISR